MKTQDYVQQYLDYGWWVFPVKQGEKHPYVEWSRYTEQPTEEWSDNGIWKNARGAWLLCGSKSGVVTLDMDKPGAEEVWRSRIGDDILDNTVATQARKGIHYYFKLEPDEVIASAFSKEDGWDFQADGGRGIMLPPSPFADGEGRYRWLRSPRRYEMAPLPDLLRHLKRPGGQDRGNPTGNGDGGRSRLADLLSSPPTEGGRNTWMTQVCGHFAASMRSKPDAVAALMVTLNSTLSPPLDQEELDKIIWSITKTENEKGDIADDRNGYLVGDGERLWTPCKVGQETVLNPYSDFDLIALGVSNEGERHVFDVELHRLRDGTREQALLDSHDLADPRRLSRWLIGRGVTIVEPPGLIHRIQRGERMTRYLLDQDPPSFHVIRHLGWNHEAQAFVCHEGQITADEGLQDHQGIRPLTSLRNTAPYHYGTHDHNEARRILREVLTFHFTEEAAVFGAWWAACLLKPQIQTHVSQFPIMAIEAPSESGKTKGMFGMLIQLSGNTKPQGIWTSAALRDALAAHHSGIVWVDDQDSLQHIHELMRTVTSGGTVTKKGEDFSQVEAELVAPLVISGEALGIRDQKALLDRSLILEVRSPTKRRSLYDGSKAQWDDIVSLRQRYNDDLTVVAGDIVQLALQQAHVIEELPSLRGVQGSRYADKIAVIRTGSRILAGMTGDPGWVDAVDSWIDDTIDYIEEDNTLTQKLLPTCLAVCGTSANPSHREGFSVPTPVVVRNGIVLFSPTHLALWWEQYKRGRVTERTESAEAIKLQAKVAGAVHTQVIKVTQDAIAKGAPASMRMLTLDPEMSALVIHRSGIFDEDTDQGSLGV